jgi:hypothetical protein
MIKSRTKITKMIRITKMTLVMMKHAQNSLGTVTSIMKLVSIKFHAAVIKLLITIFAVLKMTGGAQNHIT